MPTIADGQQRLATSSILLALPFSLRARGHDFKLGHYPLPFHRRAPRCPDTGSQRFAKRADQ